LILLALLALAPTPAITVHAFAKLTVRPGNVFGTHAIEAASVSSAASAAKVYYFYFSEVPELNEKSTP
jgi:hypothetical protein